MNLIIDFDAISDAEKKDWRLRNLKIMDICFYTLEKPQTLEEYNNELEQGSAELKKATL